MTKKRTIAIPALQSILIAAMSIAGLHAEKIPALFNGTTIVADKSAERNDAIFNLGSPVDFARGSILFWVRPEWYGGEKTAIPLAAIIDSTGTGISLVKGTYQNSILLEVRSNHIVTGRVYQEIADWIPGFSHHVAAAWGPDELRLTIDGVNKTLAHTPLRQGSQTERLPEKPGALDKLITTKIVAGGPRTSFSNIVISDRSLSVQEIDDIRKKQCPVRLNIEIPDRPLRLIGPGESVSLRIKNDGGQPVKTRLTYMVDNLTTEVPIVEKTETIEVTIPANSGITAKEIVVSQYGLFQVRAELRTLTGEIISQDSKPFGSGMRDPNKKNMPESPFGWATSKPSTYAASIQQTGASWVRDQSHIGSWMHVEPEKGKYDWSATDALMNDIRSSGIHSMPILMVLPKWASSAPNEKDFSLYAPENLQDYSNYVYQMVNRYKGTISTWEVWNEPNGGFLLWDKKNNRPYGPYAQESIRSYFDLHQTAYLAAKSADPKARIVGPCFQGFQSTYLESLIKLGILKYTDIVSWHIYTTPNSPESENLEKNLQQLVKIVRDAGGMQPIWNTEYAYWTPPRDTTAPVPKKDIAARFAEKDPSYRRRGDIWPFRALDEWTAANNYIRFALINLACGIDKLFPYEYGYHPAWQSADVNNSPYLHTIAFNEMSRQLAGLKFVRKVTAHSDTRYVYLFGNGKRTIAAVWTTDTADSIVLKVGSADPKVSDLFGNPVKTVLKNGNLTLSISGTPRYIEGVSADMECQKDLLSVSCPEVIYDERPVALTANIENTGDEPIAGTIALALPDGWKTKNTGTRFQIPPGEKKQLNFYVDANSPNGMYAVKMIGEISGAASIISTKNIYKRIPAPCYLKRDGKYNGSPLVLSNRSQVVKGLLNPGQAIADAVDEWKGPSDSSAVITPAWDMNNFYLTIDVVDKIISTKSSAPWEGDCIELFIDESGTKSNMRTVVDKDCSQLFLFLKGKEKSFA